MGRSGSKGIPCAYLTIESFRAGHALNKSEEIVLPDRSQESYMKFEDIESLYDANQALQHSNIKVKIGLFGGRKFYLGNDTRHSLSMKELIGKVRELALKEDKEDKLSPEALERTKQMLSALNERGDYEAGSGQVIGKINMALLRMRRSFGPSPANRFLPLDNLHKDLREKETQALKDHKDDFLEVLQGTKTLDQTALPPFLKEELRPHIGRALSAKQRLKGLDIPDDPNERQLEDILSRVKKDSDLCFQSSIALLGRVAGQISNILQPLNNSALLPANLEQQYTNTEIEFAQSRLLEHKRSQFTLRDSQDPSVLRDYILHLLAHPGEDTSAWFTNNQLHRPL